MNLSGLWRYIEDNNNNNENDKCLLEIVEWALTPLITEHLTYLTESSQRNMWGRKWGPFWLQDLRYESRVNRLESTDQICPQDLSGPRHFCCSKAMLFYLYTDCGCFGQQPWMAVMDTLVAWKTKLFTPGPSQKVCGWLWRNFLLLHTLPRPFPTVKSEEKKNFFKVFLGPCYAPTFQAVCILWAQKTEAGVRFNTESVRSDAGVRFSTKE